MAMTSLTANQNSNCNQSFEAIVQKVLTVTGMHMRENNAYSMKGTSVAVDPEAEIVCVSELGEITGKFQAAFF